jgi:hypothetical protein
VEVLLNTLSDSVPYRDFAATRNQLELYKAKTRLFLEREQDWIAEKCQHDSDIKELEDSRENIAKLEYDLLEAKNMVSIMAV